MAELGFTYYDTIPTPSQPTLQEIIDGMSGPQKAAVLDGFIKKILPKRLVILVPGLNKEAVRRLYQAIDSIEETARSYMRGEVLITPAELDPETGEVITPAVYNTPPSTAGELLTAVQDEFSDVFTGAQVNAILSKMIDYSKYDGTGDWEFYATEVVK